MSNQTAAALATSSAPAASALLLPRECLILRKLAGRVAELAARPIEQKKRELWYAHNSLQATRPLVFCDPENGWGEIITQDDLRCETPLARTWEYSLRREIFWGEHMQDDRVIQPTFEIGYVFTESDWGMHETRIGGGHGDAYTWQAPLDTFAKLAALRFPHINVDYAATTRLVALAQNVLGDLLPIRLRSSWWWTLGMTWTAVNLRGLNQLMLDMLDYPDELHRFIAFLRDGTQARLDYLEENGLLSLNNDGTYVGSGGFGWSRELPSDEYSGLVRCRDLWGFGESQETTLVSPAMFGEFILPYQLPILERFGLNCYGCCEPLDKRWDYVRRVPRLRRVSVSAWADVADMAEKLSEGYIYSWKPRPTDLAMTAFDEERIRTELRAMMRTTRNCRVEIIMKDNNTLRNDPTRAVRWTRIAREEAERL
ncbi:MAG: hypothetical protein LLG44_08530 [Chloroflexi bacterium]|nr:hypothetical protein [Chloroflexota bacterium]